MSIRLPENVTLCLGVGAQKAGTTWLATYFEAHPSIMMSPIKELHYFDALWMPDRMGKRNQQHLRQLKRRSAAMTLEGVTARDAKWIDVGAQYDRLEMIGGGHEKYLEFFAKRVGDCSVAAEISPSYSMLSAENFREIRGLHPRMKAVFLMRNPIDRVWSALRHVERHGRSVEERFDRAIQTEGMELRTDYGRTLDALAEGFPVEDTFIEFYEDLFNESTIRRLCEFLSIPYHPAPFGTVVNKAKEKAMTPEQRARIGAIVHPVYEYCHRRFGDQLPKRWQADMQAISQGN